MVGWPLKVGGVGVEETRREEGVVWFCAGLGLGFVEEKSQNCGRSKSQSRWGL